MEKLKKYLLNLEEQTPVKIKDSIEVVGLSIASCLETVAAHWNTTLMALDYEVLQKAKVTLFKTIPYRLRVRLLPEDQRFSELSEFSEKLGFGSKLLDKDLDRYIVPKNKDSYAIVRNYKHGVFLTVFPALGSGHLVKQEEVMRLIRIAGAEGYNEAIIERAIREAKGIPVKIAELKHQMQNDASYKIEISNDKMKAYIYISAPRSGGLHIQVNDIVAILKSYKIVVGFKEKEVVEALNKDDYNKPILIAEGLAPRIGADAKIEYKTKVKKEFVALEEDSSGRVDFKQLNTIENVVIGQVLAKKIPAQKGEMGYDLYNQVLPGRDGNDVSLKAGKGTILSIDGTELIAQVNGQAALVRGVINVEPIFRIMGDVGPKTGNINFIGSVYVHGSVLSGFEVKASSNIEVHGSVTKGLLEAEGDIVLPSGVTSSKVTSTFGNIYAKYVQDSNLYASHNIFVAESILRSHLGAGESIICTGRRAQVVGGVLRALKEIRARIIGSVAFTATEVTVGTEPFLLARVENAKKYLKESPAKVQHIKDIVASLEFRKKAEGKNFNNELNEELQKNIDELRSIEAKCIEAKKIIQDLAEKQAQQQAQDSIDAKIHAEKQIFPGVVINIVNARQSIGDTFGSATLSYDKGYIKMNKLEKRTDATLTYQKRKMR